MTVTVRAAPCQPFRLSCLRELCWALPMCAAHLGLCVVVGVGLLGWLGIARTPARGDQDGGSGPQGNGAAAEDRRASMGLRRDCLEEGEVGLVGRSGLHPGGLWSQEEECPPFPGSQLPSDQDATRCQGAEGCVLPSTGQPQPVGLGRMLQSWERLLPQMRALKAL